MMETIAITFWNGLVSPLFDAAATVLIVGPGQERHHISLGNGPLYTKAEILEKHAVKILICGAISADALSILHERNIRVVSWISGPVENVLKAHETNTLEAGPFTMPGCGRNRRCRRGNRRGRGGGRRFDLTGWDNRQKEIL